MKYRYLLSLLLFPLLLTSCGEEETPEPSSYKRTVLVYIAADNNLAPFALQDLEEMKEGMAGVADGTLHLLVYIDTGSSPRLVELKKRDGQVVEDVVRTYDDRNSVGVDETREVFDAVFANPDFQAGSYGLIYWSHADGWVPYPVPSTRWVGQDTGEGDKRMNLSGFCPISTSSCSTPASWPPSRWPTSCAALRTITSARPPRTPVPALPTNVSCPS